MLSPRGNLDVHDQPAVERHDESHAGIVDVEAADGVARAALEDADDPAFRAAVGDPLDAGHDAIAMHRLIQIAAGNVDVARHLLERPIRHDEAKAARVGRDPADDEIHPVGQAVTVAARLHQLAVGHQLPEQALESRALLTGKLEPLEQLARGGGVVYLFANQLEELFLVEHT